MILLKEKEDNVSIRKINIRRIWILLLKYNKYNNNNICIRSIARNSEIEFIIEDLL